VDLSWKDGGADLSPDGYYRYRLWRRWAPRNNGQGHVVFVMLNPSTADANDDDATIRRCIGYGKRWGHGGLEVVNLFAFRATDPKALRWNGGVATGDPTNLETIVDVCSKNGPIVMAWGANADRHRDRVVDVETQLRRLRVPLHTLGLTTRGQPLHPLRLAASRVPIVQETPVFFPNGRIETQAAVRIH
jgi:hypothetical protein